MTSWRQRFLTLAAFAALSGCATQYEKYQEIPVEGMTQAQVVQHLDLLKIKHEYVTCEQASATANRPAECCNHKHSVGIIRAIPNDGQYLMGVGHHWVQLHIELGPDETVVAVREERATTLF